MMGCAFSRNRVRVPRIFKRKKVSRSQKYLSSTPPSVSTLKTGVGVTNCHSVQSERPATPSHNKQTAEYYTPDVAPSTLLWLVGPKDCVEISIPELANLNDHSNTNEKENKRHESILPACLEYQGYHEYGFHLFTLKSSVFNSTVQDMSIDCVPDAIASIVCDDNEPFVLVYKNNNNQTTYLPNPPAWGKDLLHRICTRSSVTQKLRVTSDFKELARLTGFPGEIKRKSP